MAYEDLYFFFNDTATTEIYTLSLHDALPISPEQLARLLRAVDDELGLAPGAEVTTEANPDSVDAASLEVLRAARSEEHTSELQSRQYLVCSLLLEKKINIIS